MRTLNLLIVLIVLACNCFSQAVLSKQPDNIYICTYNVYLLGNISEKYESLEEDYEGTPSSQIPERIKNNANVLKTANFDLIVLQEVKEGEAGYWAVSDLVSELNKGRDSKYKFIQSEDIGYGFTMNESMAFIYDPSVVEPQLITGQTSLFDYIATGPLDDRKFVRTQWISGDFDFTLISCHVAWGNKDKRDESLAKANEILYTPTPSRYSYDPDIILLGDFNRFGKGYNSAENIKYDSKVVLAPNITYFDPDFNSITNVTKTSIKGKDIPNNNPQLLSTTVAKNTSVYDMIMFTYDAGEEYNKTISETKYGEDFGIIHFDEKDGFGYQEGADELSHESLKRSYSDHRPLWVRFNTNTGNSDPEISTEIKYVGTKYGSKFHLPGCSKISNSTIVYEWSSYDEAIKEKAPCKSCKPMN